MKREITLILLIILATFSLSMHGQTRHELSAVAGAGLSGLDYTYGSSRSESRFGSRFGLGYSYYITSGLSLRSGLELSFYGSELSSGYCHGVKQQIDPAGEPFDFSYTYTNYREELSATYLTVPVMLQYTTPGRVGFYASGGFKLGIPASGKVRSVGLLTTIGEMEQYRLIDAQALRDMPGRGFVSSLPVDREGDYALGVSLMLSAECGVRVKTSGRFSVYAGVYVDWGVTDVNRESVSSESLIGYQPSSPGEFTYGSLSSGASRIGTAGAGVTVRIGFGL